jgi:hypothetical protein
VSGRPFVRAPDAWIDSKVLVIDSGPAKKFVQAVCIVAVSPMSTTKLGSLSNARLVGAMGISTPRKLKTKWESGNPISASVTGFSMPQSGDDR